jgi:choice-of-anchor A domain-containing protein
MWGYAMRKVGMLPLMVAGLIAVANAGAASAALVGQSVSTGIAALKEWNVVAFNNFSTANHVGGRALVGGNLNVTNGVMAMDGSSLNSSSYGTPAITVAGSANFSNASVNAAGVQVGGNLTGNFNNNGSGAVQVGGTAQSQQNFAVQGNQGASFTNTLIGQANDIKVSLTSLSSNLAALASTGGVTVGGDSNNQSITVSGTGLKVLNWTEAMFEGNQNQQLAMTVPSGATLVINVAGTDIDFNRNFNTYANMSNVLFNFYEATTLDIGRQFSGSILGVFADITGGNSGNIDGSVIGRSVVQNANGEIHNLPFQGDLSSVGSVVSTAPEPSTWAMLILGFGLVGLAMRRRERRALIVQMA